MSFVVRELPRAKEDKRQIFEWLLGRSKQGAASWLDAYDNAIARLRDHAEVFGKALEHEDCPRVDARQVLFKTRRGRTYRIVFFVVQFEVFVLRVRGPGQPRLRRDEM